MKVLFQLGHPAHFHLFRYTIDALNRDGHQTYILIRKKDILEDLLREAGLPYVNILPSGRKSSFTLMLRLWRVFWFTLRHGVDVLAGSTPEVAQVAWLLRRRSVIMAEDDAEIVPPFIRAVKPVNIGSRVWIMPNVTIIYGVTVGDEAVIATGSVVTRDVPPRTLVAGIPAKVIKQL